MIWSSFLFTWFNAFFAFLSAMIWIAAALIPIPKTAWLVARIGGGGPSAELDAILYRLGLQSCLNAAAAISAAIAAFSTTIATFVQ